MPGTGKTRTAKFILHDGPPYANRIFIWAAAEQVKGHHYQVVIQRIVSVISGWTI